MASDKENIYVQLSLLLDSYSAKKRTESAGKLMIINEYKEFAEKNISCKNESKNPLKQFVDAWNTIHPEQMISTRSLYRWISRLEKIGSEGLIDKRDAWNKGISSIPEEIWRLFKYYYLYENKPSLKSCYDRLHVTAIEKGISLSSVSAFERKANNIPKPVLVRWRDGVKAFEDLCMPYISRDYTSFKSNQIWVIDHHIFDQFVIGPGNKLMRPWGTYFEDMHFRLIVASYVRCKEPNADVVLASFVKGVNTYGIPSEIVLDNGKDYKALDIFNTEEKNRANSLAKQLYIRFIV